MAAAYLLAGELRIADGTPDVAFHEYEHLQESDAALCGAIRQMVCAEDSIRHSRTKFRGPVDLITAACKVDDEPYHFQPICPA
jgi:hypothetical protein